MMLLDIFIIVVIAIFVFKGLRLGLIEAVGGLVGIIVGIILANQYYLGVAGWLSSFIKSELVATIGGYILAFIIYETL